MGMGNPLLDISANVKQDLLDKYELKLDTAILAEDKHMPLYQELIDGYDVQYIAGGATQNSCRVAQWMLSAATGQPGATAFLGCVGNDAYGKQLEDCAAGDGVCVHYMKDDTAPTGTCAALILGGERALVANLAAANNFKPSHLDGPKSKEIVEAAQFYYCAGFFLTVSVESLVRVAEQAVATNKTFCLNLSAPFIVDFFADQLATALEYADYLFANESEAAAYATKNGLDATNLAAVALAVAASPKKNARRSRTVVFTQGHKSTLVACDNVVTEYSITPLDADQLVDTNGAGDAFVGGFLASLVQGQDIAAAVLAGHYAARHVIQVSGTTLDQPCTYYQ
jgi:adenosine kinase